MGTVGCGDCRTDYEFCHCHFFRHIVQIWAGDCFYPAFFLEYRLEYYFGKYCFGDIQLDSVSAIGRFQNSLCFVAEPLVSYRGFFGTVWNMAVDFFDFLFFKRAQPGHFCDFSAVYRDANFVGAYVLLGRKIVKEYTCVII